MNRIKILIAATMLIGVGMTGCKQKVSEVTTEDSSALMVPQDPRFTAIESYLVDSIGMNYAPGEVCIPVYCVISIQNESETDQNNSTSDTGVKVWGDWWVFNFNIAGDTLKCVSGGSHPGMFLLQRDGEDYRIARFDQVEDGSNNQTSAQRIFGNLYKVFHAINSNQELRDSVRLAMVAEYVRNHNIPVSILQDYGWPAVALPTVE